MKPTVTDRTNVAHRTGGSMSKPIGRTNMVKSDSVEKIPLKTLKLCRYVFLGGITGIVEDLVSTWTSEDSLDVSIVEESGEDVTK
jgi:hypothetical protein